MDERWPLAGQEEMKQPWWTDIQPPELWEVNVSCLNHPVCGIVLWQFISHFTWSQQTEDVPDFPIHHSQNPFIAAFVTSSPFSLSCHGQLPQDLRLPEPSLEALRFSQIEALQEFTETLLKALVASTCHCPKANAHILGIGYGSTLPGTHICSGYPWLHNKSFQNLMA